MTCRLCNHHCNQGRNCPYRVQRRISPLSWGIGGMRVRIEGKGEWENAQEAADALGITKKHLFAALNNGTEHLIRTKPRRQWSQADDRFIRRCVAWGWGYAKIGHVLGVTKNAVAGRVHRLNAKPDPCVKTTQRNLICDCDGVLLNWEKGFRQWLIDEGIASPSSTGPHSWNLDDWVGQPARPLVERFNASEKFSQLEPMPDAVDVLRSLSNAGHRVDVITSCSSDANVQQMRRFNLLRAFGPIFTNIICLDLGESKAPYLRKFPQSYWVEDHPGHGADGRDIGHKVFLIRHPHNRSQETQGDGLTWVDHWSEIQSHITGDAHETISGVQ